MNTTTKSAPFTPGPWQISAIQNEPEKMSIIDADMCFVAEVWQTYIDGESRQQAHAALIAAAPAMYEALQQLVHVEQLRKQAVTENDYVDLVLADSKLQQLVQAVLAQAEGRHHE